MNYILIFFFVFIKTTYSHVLIVELFWMVIVDHRSYNAFLFNTILIVKNVFFFKEIEKNNNLPEIFLFADQFQETRNTAAADRTLEVMIK